MKHLFSLLLLISVASVNGQQLYEKSGGVRLGSTSGITYKKFVNESQAFELLLSGRNDGLQVNLLYLFHEPMEFSFNDRFYLFYGLGGHIGFEKFDDISKTIINAEGDQFMFEEKTFFAMGIDGSIGIEYRWLEVPMTIGFDLKPYFNFIGMRHMRAKFWDSAISFKYVF